MPLPSCQCNAGLPPQQQLGNIYCVLLQILENGGGGGSITLSQISDLNSSWIAPLQSPLSNFSITASQISNLSNGAVLNFLTGFPTPMGTNNIPSVDASNNWTAQGVNQADGAVTPVTSATYTKGVVTAVA